MTNNNGTVIEVRNLRKEYSGVTVVDGLSFDVYEGEIFGMLGPNGAGKTTSIECIEGLRTPDGGTLRVLGMEPLADGYALREQIGVQFQAAALPNRIKVREALDLFASFYPRALDIDVLLGQIGLSEKAGSFVNKLSGGQRQRLFIALALINDPNLVFLDELTTGLDPQARRAMWELVEDIRARGKTVFLTTHFMEEAERLCDRVAIMDEGRLIALDTPGALIAGLDAESRVVFEPEGRFEAADALLSADEVQRVEAFGGRVVVYGSGDTLLQTVVTTLTAAGVRFNNLRMEQPTLEDVFLALTGKEMRE